MSEWFSFQKCLNHCSLLHSSSSSSNSDLLLHSSSSSSKVKMSIEERFTQNLTDHFKENKKRLIPKCDYQKTIDALKAAADNSHAKGRHGYYLLEK